MGWKMKTWVGLFLLVLLPVPGYPQDEKYDLVQEIYARSGMEKQLEQVPLIIQLGLDQAAAEDDRLRGLSSNLTVAMKRLAREAFAPRFLRETMLGELNERLSLGELQEVLKWLDSPLGERCSRLEEAASTPEALAKIEQYSAQLRNSPPTAERLDALRRLDSAVRGTEASVWIAIDTQVAVALAILSTLPIEQRAPRAHIAREVEKARPQIEAAVRMQAVVSMLYTYRSLTEAEIHQYLVFATSPVGAKYHAVALAAFKKAFLIGSTNWGKAIGKELQESKDKSET